MKLGENTYPCQQTSLYVYFSLGFLEGGGHAQLCLGLLPDWCVGYSTVMHRFRGTEQQVGSWWTPVPKAAILSARAQEGVSQEENRGYVLRKRLPDWTVKSPSLLAHFIVLVNLQIRVIGLWRKTKMRKTFPLQAFRGRVNWDLNFRLGARAVFYIL